MPQKGQWKAPNQRIEQNARRWNRPAGAWVAAHARHVKWDFAAVYCYWRIEPSRPCTLRLDAGLSPWHSGNPHGRPVFMPFT